MAIVYGPGQARVTDIRTGQKVTLDFGKTVPYTPTPYKPPYIAGDPSGAIMTRITGPATRPAPVEVKTGTPALPAAAIAAAGALGIAAPVIAGAGILYGGLQAIGLQFPWETGPGEGFISPTTRDIVKDESGRWVTSETRPDLFGGAQEQILPGPGTAVMPGNGGAFGPRVVKSWTANGWPFAMTADADGKHKRIHTVTKDGVPKSWTPYRSIVIGKSLTSGDVRRVARRVKSHVRSLKKVLSVLK